MLVDLLKLYKIVSRIPHSPEAGRALFDHLNVIGFDYADFVGFFGREVSKYDVRLGYKYTLFSDKYYHSHIMQPQAR